MPILSHTVTGYLFALLATVVWSGNFVVARGLAGALSPVELSFWRWVIAFLAILPFAGRSLLRSLPLVRGSWGKVILMALLGITCFNTFIYQAGHTTDATNMSLLATTSPVVMAAIAHLFLHERLSRFQILGLCGFQGSYIGKIQGILHCCLHCHLTHPENLSLLHASFHTATLQFPPQLPRRPPLQARFDTDGNVSSVFSFPIIYLYSPISDYPGLLYLLTFLKSDLGYPVHNILYVHSRASYLLTPFFPSHLRRNCPAHIPSS